MVILLRTAFQNKLFRYTSVLVSDVLYVGYGYYNTYFPVRIYGDKAPDIVDGLKKTPAVAVPLVLKR